MFVLRKLVNGRAVNFRNADNRGVLPFRDGKRRLYVCRSRLRGERGWQDLAFDDTFSAFRNALQDFLEGARTRTSRSPAAFNRRVVSIIEAGLL